MNGDNVCEREREREREWPQLDRETLSQSRSLVRRGVSYQAKQSGSRTVVRRVLGQTGLVVILIATRLRMAPWHISCSVNHRSLYHCIPVSLYHVLVTSLCIQSNLSFQLEPKRTKIQYKTGISAD